MAYELPLIVGGVAAVTLAVASRARSVTPYAYLMAKIRAWEARMLTDSKFEGLATSGSLEGFISGLRGTDYERALEEVGEDVEGIESALNRELLQTYDRLLELVPERVRPFVEKFAERLDVGNLKLIVQVASGGVDRETAVAHLTGGTVFSRERLEAMAGSESVPDLVEQLSETDYYRQLRPYMEPGEYDPRELMRAIEHSYYRSLWHRIEELDRRNRSIARDLIGLEIDLANVRLLFRLKSVGVHPDLIMKNVIPVEANLTEETLRQCAQAEDTEQVRTILLGSSLRRLLTGIFAEARDRVTEIERLTNEAVLNHSKTMSLMKPLTVATLVAYLYQKHSEIGNLRTVARGTGDGVETDYIKSMVTRVARIE